MFRTHSLVKIIWVFSALFLSVLWVAGCSLATTSPFASPLTALESPLPSPDEASSEVLTIDIPRPGTDTGVLVGRIFSLSLGTYLPEYPIYLGEIVPLEPGDEYLITLQQKESPNVISTADGYVVFESVPPGEYALIVWLPFASQVVPDPANPGKEIRIQIVAGQVTNFGSVDVIFP